MKHGSSWRVVDRGVNGKPFLWKKRNSSRYLMIDIFNTKPKGCYAVLVLDKNPLRMDDVRGKVVGMGCADAQSDWNGAYAKARMIADTYMDKHSR